ncbi:MAG TPA: flagellar basal-body MS-ring/collar protein FliF [Alphaproteobacteria bacterium]|nr:flagellar basal-body MS-ring/collar protein FliF [Alphaproteobacteria bacterium]
MIQLLRTLGAGRVAGLGAIVLSAVGFFAFVMLRMTTPDMALLYSGLEPEDAGHIVAQLEQRNIPYELKANGTQIMVPSPQVPNVRVALAQEGLPHGGTVGYEIFDKPDALGSSNFVRDINRLRALEGELSRTIRSIDGIKSARVHLVLPRRELFSAERQEPSASIALAMRTAERPSAQVVAAIQHLVASAVPGLKSARVSVIDDRGTLLARGAGDGNDDSLAGLSSDERRRAYEDQVRRKIIEILEPIVGADRVRAEVTADMDFDRLSTTSEEFDPNTQVARSTQSVTDSAANSEAQPSQQPVTATTNIPGAPPVPPQSPPQSPKNSNTTAHNEETTNYEISKTVKNFVHEAGNLKRLSVAVMLDGVYATDVSGAHTYQPRSKQELDQLTAMVRSAVGIDDKRGDRLELINLRFAGPDEASVPEEKISFFGQFSPNDLFRIAEILVLALVAILVIMLVIRPLMKRLFEIKPVVASATGQGSAAMLPNQAGVTAAIAGPSGGDSSRSNVGDANQIEESGGIDIGQVEGRVRRSSIKKVGEIVEKHPEEAVAILRNWMVQES